MPSNHLILSLPLLLLPSIFPTSVSFPISQLFSLGGQSIGASASASVLPMNIQDWFPLGLTSWISLLSNELSRVSPTAQLKSITSSAVSFLYGPALTFVGKVTSLLFNGLSKLVIALPPRSKHLLRWYFIICTKRWYFIIYILYSFNRI